MARRQNRLLDDGSDLDDESEEGKYRRRRFVQRINLGSPASPASH
ncbi:MAG: hypothetical protein OXT05_18475 [Chloroflexota bacterium]|nr:hypothetical protein [Chloroflexota bacterium]MDE2855460.1 hypothetical protein [Chloroflexota bacterium]MDE2949079.1 hypothetical protein [Chloroflexota bacterium]